MPALLCQVALLCGGFFRLLHNLQPDKQVHHGREVNGEDSVSGYLPIERYRGSAARYSICTQQIRAMPSPAQSLA